MWLRETRLYGRFPAGKGRGKLAGNWMEEQKEPESKEVVKTTSNGAESGAYNRSELPELLKVYYKWLFPYDKYFEWLQYGEQTLCCVHNCDNYMYICPSLASHTHCRVRKSLVALHVTMKLLPWQNFVVTNEIHTVHRLHPSS